MTAHDSCPDLARWKQLLEGSLPEPEQLALHAHLEACPQCQQVLESLTAGGATWAAAAQHLAEAKPGDEPALRGVMVELEAAGGQPASKGRPGPGAEETLDFLSPPDTPGQLGRLGHYQVSEIIGRGGMGIVLKAFDEKLRRVVAIKVMAAVLASNATARKRFIREAQAAAAVRHEHVIDIHAVEEANGLPYLVMEYISGQSLQQRLNRTGPLEVKELLRIGMQTAAGLAAAHSLGLIHRDIKPANILLENGVERVKIADFGLARAVDDVSLTQSGLVAGTPEYMAPEQARGEEVDHRADLFSLGSVLYAMCTGRPPFRAGSTLALLKRVSEEIPRPIKQLNPDVPDSLTAIIDRLHAKDPADRFQSADEVAEILGQRLASLQQPVLGAGRPARIRRRRRWTVAAGILLCGLASLGLSEATGLTRVATTLLGIRKPSELASIQAGDQPGNTLVKGHDQPAAPAANGAFVLLASGKERPFDTLAEAVMHADDGVTIEVRGNGPFVGGPVRSTRAITIRAGKGFRPVLELNGEGIKAGATLLQADDRLVLEGLSLRLAGHGLPRLGSPVPPPDSPWPQLLGGRGPVHVANCSFFSDAIARSMHLGENPVLAVRNSQFVMAEAIVHQFSPTTRIDLDNNVLATWRMQPLMVPVDGTLRNAEYHLTHNTLLGEAGAVHILLNTPPAATAGDGKQATKPLHIQASANIFDGHDVALSLQFEALAPSLAEPKRIDEFLQRLMEWREESNLYADKAPLLRVWVKGGHGPARQWDTLADWKRVWRLAADDSRQGRARYQGGSKLYTAPEQLTPDDFRLRPDSAGYRAGKDGKDLGADIDLVGPGPAYERWKRTPAYQQWLKDTGQKHEVLPPEVQAVIARLKQLNPGFDGQVRPKFENGVVTELDIPAHHVADLSPLKTLSALKWLACRVEVAEQGPGELTDLSPLQGLHLTYFSCHNTRVSDLSPLQGMPLDVLYASRTKVQNLAPLAAMPLTVLSIGDTRVSDLSPLIRIPLKRLHIDRTQVEDLSALAGMPLEELKARETRIADLSPLKGMPLKGLFIHDTRVRDLSPLRGMPLEVIELRRSSVFDRDVIQQNLEVLRSLKSLTTIDDQPAADFLKHAEQGPPP
jgi:serine/threonine protein kinase